MKTAEDERTENNPEKSERTYLKAPTVDYFDSFWALPFL
jgi:hypothetical protein